MSKHSLDQDQWEFWKKLKYGATAAVAVGAGVYAVTSAVKKQGLITDLVDEVKTAVHAAPLLVQTSDVVRSASNPSSMDPPSALLSSEDEETRAVLNTQMHFAMKRHDLRRVQEISRQLDHLDYEGILTKTQPTGPAMNPSFHNATSRSCETDRLSNQAPIRKNQHVPGLNIDTQAVTATPVTAKMGIRSSASANETPSAVSEYGTDSASPCAQNSAAKIATRKPTKQTDAIKRTVGQDLSVRQAALVHLKAGDIVEALDPVTSKWIPARVHTLAKNGLVEVLWDDPGHDADGKPFHQIGEVWAEQIRVKVNHSYPPRANTPPAARMCDDVEVCPPFDLQVGDACFAMGAVVGVKWFEAKLIGVRSRSPPLRVEYLATLDGQTNELLLPSPRKDYVNMEQIRRDKPDGSTEWSRERRIPKNENKLEACSKEAQESVRQNTLPSDGNADDKVDEVVITADLMCTVCQRPDDEENMLVCDCKKGFHIYCLSPPLEKVPEDDWFCPKCARKMATRPAIK